jgi:gas vesicle structural protein
MTMQPSSGGAVERSEETGLADVVTTILDKGVVIDVFARVSLVGIELLRVDARVVIASVDTYLRFAEAANRIEMGAKEPSDLAGVVGGTAAAIGSDGDDGGGDAGDESPAELEAGQQAPEQGGEEEKEEVVVEGSQSEREESAS